MKKTKKKAAKKSAGKSKTITLDHITKIEGHAKLVLKIRKGKVEQAKLSVVEGSRYFENILRNNNFEEVPHIAARICGLCSTSHTIAGLRAVEHAMGIEVSPQSKLLREVLHYGGIIQDHILHCFFLSLPDFLGFESAVAMASKYKKEVQLALDLKRMGNAMLTTIGGREVHPITPIVGGFSVTPNQEALNLLLKKLKDKKQDLIKAAEMFGKLKYPKFERETEYFSLQTGKYFPFLGGHISCFGGSCVPTEDYEHHFKEYFNPLSTAKFVQVRGKSYMVGALARINNNQEFLCKDSKKLIKESGIKFPNKNPFVNNFAQMVETVHAWQRSIEILETLEAQKEKPVDVYAKAGKGVGIVEAPRGMLFHDYSIDHKGDLARANIITPTTQNLKRMEDDIKIWLPSLLKKYKRERIVVEMEKLIRAYDPCISCSTHFLDVKWV